MHIQAALVPQKYIFSPNLKVKIEWDFWYQYITVKPIPVFFNYSNEIRDQYVNMHDVSIYYKF